MLKQPEYYHENRYALVSIKLNNISNFENKRDLVNLLILPFFSSQWQIVEGIKASHG